MKEFLQDIIVKVLKTHGNGLTAKEISDIIEKEGLWKRPKDHKYPPSNQISARIPYHLDLFEKRNGKIYLKDSAETRLLRLTYNENMWHRPSVHRWSVRNQHNSDIAHENQFGFGGEEWLFNPNFQDDGYQYGYIRGAENLADEVNFIDKAYLFTINQETSERFLVAIVNGLERLTDKGSIKKAKQLFAAHRAEMKRDLEVVGADVAGFSEYFVPTVRFKTSDILVFDELVPAPFLEGRKYNRFQPYKVDDTLENVLISVAEDNRFIFRPGIAKNKKGYVRNTSTKTSTVQRIHSDISDELVKFLKPHFTVEKKNISVEKSGVGLNTPDVVIKHAESEYSLFEIKTSISGRKNIREALGQLMDYAYWDNSVTIKEAVMVSPSRLSEKEKGLFREIKRNLKLKIRYLQFNNISGKGSFEYIF